ncbi:hypothetical protein [Methylobacterium sp. Leaf100]|uniref:hypothetical protein n=1 Tax=Methylobacterium sp. Leaf100 TaxID=1736252 RepID=UPI000AF8FF16|nr:hypothetical protein [Methylobacterium sp. Leaf100]
MIRQSELDVHVRAQELFERENPGCLWRAPPSAAYQPSAPRRTASMIERQIYLARVRERMQAEGVQLVTDEEPTP